MQASEVLLLPWLPGSSYPPPRGLQVFGYVASERRLHDLTNRVFCRPAQNPVGDTVDRKSQSACPPNLRMADESLERPRPGTPPIKAVWGTGTNQADQLVLGLKGPQHRNIAPNFLFGSTADWVWRAWIGPAHRIWTVTRPQLQIAKNTLNKIDSWWFQRGDSCLPRYQQTPIQLSASVYTQGVGGERIFLPDVDKGGALMLDFTSLLPKNSLQVLAVDSFGAQQPAAEVIWTNEGPFLVGLHRGLVSVQFKPMELNSSQTVAVSDEPVFVSRFLSECLKENATISGQLDSFPLKGSSLEQFDFNLPMLQRLHLTAHNYLVASLISSARNHSLLQLEQYSQQQQRPGPEHRQFDACPLQRTVNSFLFSDNSIQPLHQLATGMVRLQAPSNDQWIVWDPAKKSPGDAEIRLSGTTAWSSHPNCMGSFLLGSVAPIAAMDEALILAQLEQKWHPVPTGALTDLSHFSADADRSIPSTKFAIIFGAICAAALVIIIIQCAIVLAIRKRKNVSCKQRLVLETVAPPGSECGYCGGSSLLRQATANHSPSPLMMSSSISRGPPTMVRPRLQ
ncbi:hypothetical protein Ciccas_005277 [Cichlidogyrus casuarinus]|uniref:Transmembrane protein n=1 Tax=Cichlidogyrus casuarinus TaxID=1844966 RepID=A0ABD2Q9J6_9PLAT